MRIRSMIAAAVGGVAVLTAGTGAAFAGEVNGNQKPIPAPQHARSECVYSGQNNFNEPTDPGRTQTFGQIVKVAGPLGGVPGTACNPTKSSGGA